MTAKAEIEKKYKPWIVILSIVIPVAVALLFTFKIDGYDTSFLPPIYATTNAITAILLVLGVIAIKNGKRRIHQKFMTAAIAFSALFLLLYVAYHITSDHTSFGGTGWVKTVYFILLISHIALSIGIIPLVLVTYVKALAERFDRHKKIAKITFPIWLYVAVSGVVVYLMISPYYA